MSTYRYSGDIRIRITYTDKNMYGTAGTLRFPNGVYRCFLRAGEHTATVIVGAPSYLSHAVDSPEAFDEAARSAITFAQDSENKPAKSDWYNVCCWWEEDGETILIGRNKRNAWPTSKLETAYNEMNRKELGLGYMQGKKGL